jgi:hypothetical protein
MNSSTVLRVRLKGADGREIDTIACTRSSEQITDAIEDVITRDLQWDLTDVIFRVRLATDQQIARVRLPILIQLILDPAQPLLFTDANTLDVQVTSRSAATPSAQAGAGTGGSTASRQLPQATSSDDAPPSTSRLVGQSEQQQQQQQQQGRSGSTAAKKGRQRTEPNPKADLEQEMHSLCDQLMAQYPSGKFALVSHKGSYYPPAEWVIVEHLYERYHKLIPTLTPPHIRKKLLQ